MNVMAKKKKRLTTKELSKIIQSDPKSFPNYGLRMCNRCDVGVWSDDPTGSPHHCGGQLGPMIGSTVR